MKLLILLAVALQAREPVVYRVRFDNADHHEAEVIAVFEDVPSAMLELRMSRSSPGRYALHEFAKNVYVYEYCPYDGSKLRIESKH